MPQTDYRITKLLDYDLWCDGTICVDSADKAANFIAEGINPSRISMMQITDEVKRYNRLVSADEQIDIKRDWKSFSNEWNLPEHYKCLNVAQYIIDQFDKTNSNHQEQRLKRIGYEYKLFKNKGLLNILRVMIYIVETFEQQNIVWGVGRGSSVSSYILYLIGIHDIDSYKYQLDIHDFLKT